MRATLPASRPSPRVRRASHQARLADQTHDSAHETGHVRVPLPLEQPRRQLHRPFDDGRRSRHTSLHELVEDVLGQLVVGEKHLGEHGGVLERHGSPQGKGRRAGVRSVADHDRAAAVPRALDQEGLEQRIVDPVGVGDVVPDRVPRPVVRRRQLAHRRDLLLRRGA